jgi:RHS repeat-associated protein
MQTSQLKLMLSSTVHQQYDYSYGQFNTSTGAVDTSKNKGQIGKIDATIGTTAQWNQGFSYDELGRLSNVVEYQGSGMTTQTFAQGYSYDRFGNRMQSANSTLGLLAVSSSDYDTSNNNNRFVSSVASYDASGNILTDGKFRSLTYTYDANGRQKSASNGTWTQTQAYDVAGQRVQTTVGSTTRTIVYDSFGRNVAEYSGSTLEREHIYRGNCLLAIYEAGSSTVRYVLTDLQGSTRAIVNSSGAVTARHDYLPFGEEVGAGIGLRTSGQGFGATDSNRQRYGLTERDGTTGLDHTLWRKYENLGGRWTSPDPMRGNIDAPQSFNSYSYAANDPVSFVDPTGLDPQDPLTPPTTTHIDPHSGETVEVPGIDAGVVTISGENSGLGMFGADTNHIVAVINFQDLKRPVGTREYDVRKIIEDAIREKEERKKRVFGAWEEYRNCVTSSPGYAEYRKGLQGVPTVSSPLPSMGTYGGGVVAKRVLFGANIASRANVFGLFRTVAWWGFFMTADYDYLERQLYQKHLAATDRECAEKHKQKYGYYPRYPQFVKGEWIP